MGSWGSRSFDNDTAMDWLLKLHKTSDFSLVRKALLRTSEPATEPYSHSADEEALAAAEIVASWLGHPPPEKEDLQSWVRQHINWFTPEILTLARQTIAAIKTNSQLREMWSDRTGDVRPEWLNSVTDLEQRLW